MARCHVNVLVMDVGLDCCPMVSGQETTRLVLKVRLAGESKADVADFILNQLIDDNYLRKMPTIAY